MNQPTNDPTCTHCHLPEAQHGTQGWCDTQVTHAAPGALRFTSDQLTDPAQSKARWEAATASDQARMAELAGDRNLETYECESCGLEVYESMAQEHDDEHFGRVVISREGARGHYLSALMVDDAHDLALEHLQTMQPAPRTITTGLMGEPLTGADRAAFDLDETYRAQLVELATEMHYGDTFASASDWYQHACDQDWSDGSGATYSETCQWWTDAAESMLSDIGYAITWDDGYAIEDTRMPLTAGVVGSTDIDSEPCEHGNPEGSCDDCARETAEDERADAQRARDQDDLADAHHDIATDSNGWEEVLGS